MAKKLNGKKLGPWFNLRAIGQILLVPQMLGLWFTEINSISQQNTFQGTRHVHFGPNDSRNTSTMWGFVFGACAKAPKGFIFFTVSEPILCILRAQHSIKTESLKWNDVENPVCLKLAVRDTLIYHRGWEVAGEWKPSKETFNVNKSYFCHFVLLPSRVIILE